MKEFVSYMCSGLESHGNAIKSLQKGLKAEKRMDNLLVIAVAVCAVNIVVLKDRLDDQEEKINKLRKEVRELKCGDVS